VFKPESQDDKKTILLISCEILEGGKVEFCGSDRHKLGNHDFTVNVFFMFF
jgi:hypothetical protein